MDGLGLIGNCQYSALVRNDGNVAWMCWPRFDSSFVFGGLLDETRGGVFSIAPANGGQGVQKYLTNTNVLRTRFKSKDGTFDVIDFAPRYQHMDRHHKPTVLVRIIEPVEGQPLIRVRCKPVDNYGKRALIGVMGADDIIYEGGEIPIRLNTDVARTYILEDRPFILSRRHYFVLTQGEHVDGHLQNICENLLNQTVQYWRRWVKHCHLPEVYQREVIRSALVLKLHQFEDTGAVIAATTTSIPEAPESSRNWDYRYCWLRDSYFTIQALMRLSHFEEFEGFGNFLRNTLRADLGRVYPMYKITGEHDIPETELTELSGYQNHKPVRIGNAASYQIQNDAYGQALLALSPLFTDVRFLEENEGRPAGRMLELVEWLVEGMEKTIDQPDAGIWEFRGIERPHAFTSLMHWAGARATARAATQLDRQDLKERCLALASRAGRHLQEECWNEELGSFVMAPGTRDVDASMLLAINLGFLRHDKKRASRMIDTMIEHLSTPNGLIQRYCIPDDGFGETTSCFTVCSFWLAEALAHVGRVEEAIEVFDKVLDHSNNTGLLSEDIDPQTGMQWGNFPQTYSHVGVINAAFAIQTALTSDEVNMTVNAQLYERFKL